MAAQLGVVAASILNWEANVSQPDYKYTPAIIAFLGYNPLPDAKTIAEQLVRHRTTLGLSQDESARRIRVDPSTLAKWERGEREPTGAALERAEHFLHGDDGEHPASHSVDRAEQREGSGGCCTNGNVNAAL